MSLNFCGIKNITASGIPRARMQTPIGELNCSGIRTTMYLDNKGNKDLDMMKKHIKGNYLEVVQMRANDAPQISGILINGKPVLGALNNFNLINKLGTIFNKIQKMSNKDFIIENDFLSKQVYKDISGRNNEISNILKKEYTTDEIKAYFTSPSVVKNTAKEMIKELQTTVAFETEALAQTINPKSSKELLN